MMNIKVKINVNQEELDAVLNVLKGHKKGMRMIVLSQKLENKVNNLENLILFLQSQHIIEACGKNNRSVRLAKIS